MNFYNICIAYDAMLNCIVLFVCQHYSLGVNRTTSTIMYYCVFTTLNKAKASPRLLYVFNILILITYLVPRSNAQLGLVQSVSVFPNCQASPVGAQNDGACEEFTNDEAVIVLRAQVKQTSQKLVFELRDIPGPGETRSYDSNSQTSLACQGLPVGSNCNVSNSVLTISFDATRLFAGYQLQQRTTNIPACYSVQVVTDLLNNCSNTQEANDVCKPQQQFVDTIDATLGRFTAQPCSTINGISNVGSLNADLPVGGVIQSSACPFSLNIDGANEFYQPPEQNIIYDQSGYCPLLYCPINRETKGKEQWSLSVPFAVPYMCSVYDIQPAAQGIMAADIILSTFDYDTLLPTSPIERLQVTSLNGGRPVISQSSPVVAKLLRINKGLGVAGPIVQGAVVTCNNGGPMNQSPWMMTDAPGRISPEERLQGKGSVFDDYYNPYTETNVDPAGGKSRNLRQRCTLPVATCRRMMLPQWYKDFMRNNNTPASSNDNDVNVGHYYIVTQDRLAQYGEDCNQNGMNPFDLFQNNPIMRKFCAAQVDAQNPKGDCIPGYEQSDVQVRTATPVSANANHAYYLASIKASGISEGDVVMQPVPKPEDIPGVDFMPLDYLPLNPNYWLAHNMLVREAPFGSSGQVSLDVMIVLQASKFLGAVTPRTTGKFVDTGMSCDATTSAMSRVAWTTQNQGTIAGDYFVVPTFTLPPTAKRETQLYVELDTRTINVGGKTIDVQIYSGTWKPRSDPSGGRSQAYIDYRYSGPLENTLEVTLDLYIPAGRLGEGYVKVDSILIGCTITRGVVQDLAQRSPGGKADYTQDLSNLYQCLYYYNNIFRCFGHYDRKWKLVVNLLLTGTAVIVTITAVVSGIIAVIRNYTKPSKTLDIKRSDLSEDIMQ